MRCLLREAVAAALAGHGGFQLRARDGAALSLPFRDFAGYAGHRVLWPLGGEAADLGHLLSALQAGVKPILTPLHTPPRRLEQMQQQFRAGRYRGGELEATGEQSRDTSPALLYIATSGSTGTPKAVAASAAALAAVVEGIHVAQALDEVGAAILSVPAAYSYGLVNILLWALLKERTLLLPGMTTHPSDLLAAAQAQQAEMLCLVGTQLQMLAGMAPEIEPVPGMRVVNLAGMPFPAGGQALLRRLFPNARLYNNYGCTEALPRLTVRDVSAGEAPRHNVGRPLPQVTLRIEGGHRGPVSFKAPSAALGYLQPDGSIASFSEWIATGDVGELVDGELHLLGRSDQIVTLGGERHSLLELEQAALAAGFTHAHAYLQDEAVILLVGLDGDAECAPAQLKTLQQALRGEVARVLWPARIVQLLPWPLLPNGKSDRIQARAQADLPQGHKTLWQKLVMNTP